MNLHMSTLKQSEQNVLLESDERLSTTARKQAYMSFVKKVVLHASKLS
ncbi:MAG: hypothetical protein ACJA1A_001883 [Saprospiraceae bacterium]|jgi:hypothetical protein